MGQRKDRTLTGESEIKERETNGESVEQHTSVIQYIAIKALLS